MENNTMFIIFRNCGIAILIVTIIILSIYIVEDKAQDATESQEQKLNDTYQEGYDKGYPQGVYDAVAGIISQAEQTGIVQIPIDENTTYPIFNPAGCGQQVKAELQARSCEVRCP